MFLCVDTISSVAGITLVLSDKTSYTKLDPHHASEGILEAIDKLLKDSGTKLSDLTGVFVIKGPGSFTGLRVGISVANQFAHQLKIPIMGLTIDKWWKFRTDEKDFVYLQTMNMAEVHCIGFGKLENTFPILCHPEVLEGSAKWLGDLSEDHKSKLPKNFQELTELRSIKQTWKKVIKENENYNLKLTTYSLVEPFYGKDPTITKSKKKLTLK